MNHPLVSVIIPTYKRSNYLLRAINSVLNQSYKNIEIIVIDDNDGDNEFRKATSVNLKEYIDANQIVYLKHKNNKGVPAARNTGMEYSSGKYIAFLDDDDEFCDDKIEKQVALFEASDDSLGLVYGAFLRVEVGSNKEDIIRPKYKGYLYNILGLNHIGPPSMVMVSRKAVDDIKGFDESLRHREDADFCYRLSKNFNIDYIDDILMKYYVHPHANQSSQHADKLFYMLKFMDQYRDELKAPKKRLSELQERLGELYAVNGQIKNAVSTFGKAYFNYPKRVTNIAKLFLTFLGSRRYKKIRRIQ
jgi:glycosyltransferase involved in cell wall biosynthesis